MPRIKSVSNKSVVAPFTGILIVIIGIKAPPIVALLADLGSMTPHKPFHRKGRLDSLSFFSHYRKLLIQLHLCPSRVKHR